MKKIFLLFVIVALISGTFCVPVNADNTQQFSDANITIDLTGGVANVTGSFKSAAASNEGYKVYLASYLEDDTLVDVKSYPVNTITEGTNTFSHNFGQISDVQRVVAYVWTSGMKPVCKPVVQFYRLRVLSIGNSFSQDSFEHLYKLAKSAGIQEVVLGYYYRGSAKLSAHWTNAQTDRENQYNFYWKNTADEWVSTKAAKMSTVVTDEDWDVISLQQGSGSSGMANTFDPYLGNLITYLNETKTNSRAKIVWHMTWAYAQDSTHEEFVNYNNDQMTMYNAIVGAVNSKIDTNKNISYVIPTGTTIQNMRTSYIGDTLNRDGYHLSVNLGRYAASMTWLAKITGMNIDNITWVPSTTAVTTKALEVVKESVKNALANPYVVTQSQYQQ